MLSDCVFYIYLENPSSFMLVRCISGHNMESFCQIKGYLDRKHLFNINKVWINKKKMLRSAAFSVIHRCERKWTATLVCLVLVFSWYFPSGTQASPKRGPSRARVKTQQTQCTNHERIKWRIKLNSRTWAFVHAPDTTQTPTRWMTKYQYLTTSQTHSQHFRHTKTHKRYLKTYIKYTCTPNPSTPKHQRSI